MGLFGKKEEARSWSGQTASEMAREAKSSGGGKDNPCKNGHSWAFTRYVFYNEHGTEVRYAIYDCVRGCTATKSERA